LVKNIQFLFYPPVFGALLVWNFTTIFGVRKLERSLLDDRSVVVALYQPVTVRETDRQTDGRNCYESVALCTAMLN